MRTLLIAFLLLLQGIGGKGGVGGKGGIGGGTSAPPSGCATFTDNFTTPGALSGNWTIVTAAGYTSINQGSGFAQTNPVNTKGMAVYTAATSGGDQCSQFTLSASGGGATGPGVLNSTAGTGYTWVLNAAAIYYSVGGAGVNTPVTGCVIPTTGDTVKLTYTLSTGVLAAYSNGTLVCSGTDTLNVNPTTGYPSFLLDNTGTQITAWMGQ